MAVVDSPGEGAGAPGAPGPGTRLGHYVLERKLGEGGMGAVFLGRHVELDTRVAIKVIRSDIAGNDEVARRFLTEARTAARIRSAETVQVTDFGREGGLCYLVMELVEGETLAQLVEREGPLPPERAVRTILSVARALRDAHRAGIIHRDVKPQNVMLSRDGAVKLADLGLAKFVSGEEASNGGSGTRTGVGMGTPSYMAPEQYADAAHVDHRADIFSLGVSLYQVLTGRLPFRGTTPVEYLGSIMSDPPPPLPPTSNPLLGPIVEKMLSKNARERYQSYDALVGDLERSLAPGVAAPAAPLATAPTAAVAPSTASFAGEKALTAPPARPARPWAVLGLLGVLGGAAALWLALGSATPRAPTSLPPPAPSPAPPTPAPAPATVVQVPGAQPDVEAALRLAYTAERPGAAPAAAISVLGRHHRGDWRALRDGEPLSSADVYKAMVRPQAPAFAYVFQVDSRGKLDVLFPRLPGASYSTGENPLPGDAWATVPSAAEGLRLDENLGVEHLYVVVATERWPELEGALARALRAAAPKVVQAPFGLQTRGVGGLVKAAAPAQPSAAAARKQAENVELLVSGAKGAVVVERWFRHVSRPGKEAP